MFGDTGHQPLDRNGFLGRTRLTFDQLAFIGLLVLLFPLLHIAGLPMKFAWAAFLGLFMIVGFFSVLVAGGMGIAFERPAISAALLRWSGSDLLRRYALPGLYYSTGLTLIFAYNDVVARLRFDGSFDAILNQIDRSLLWGFTTTDIARGVAATPAWLIVLGELIYFGLYPLMGAALLRVGSSQSAMAFVGTVLFAFYLGLILLRTRHRAVLPASTRLGALFDLSGTGDDRCASS